MLAPSHESRIQSIMQFCQHIKTTTCDKDSWTLLHVQCLIMEMNACSPRNKLKQRPVLLLVSFTGEIVEETLVRETVWNVVF